MHPIPSRPPARARRGLRVAAASLACGIGLLAPLVPAGAAQASTSSSTEDLSARTDGHETAQVKQLLPESDVLSHPQLGAKPPVTGGTSPGATLGQGIKDLSTTDNLSASSKDQAERRLDQALKGQSPTATSPVSKLAATSASQPASGTLGMDVSGWQPTVNWAGEYANGARFAYAKVSEGTGYVSPVYSAQASGASASGMYHGGYHFALPSQSSGAAQANAFVNNGGGWSSDGKTLPGLLDIEYNPYTSLGDSCYGMSGSAMTSWIKDFASTYKSRTGRYPAIYSTTDWLSGCGVQTSQINYLPLHVASYSGTSSPGTLPSGWKAYDLWQYSSDGPFSGDSNLFAGTPAELRSFATTAGYTPRGGTAPPGFATAQASSYTASNGRTVRFNGAIGQMWNRNRAKYGMPANNESCGLVGGGCFQSFLNGYAIYWTPSGTGTHAVYDRGAIGTLWRSAGAERNYGYPTTEETCGLVRQGCYQAYSNGYAVYWTPWGTGTHAIAMNGSIGRQWTAAGYERGLGYPTTDRTASGGQYRQSFSGGRTLTGAN